MATRRRAAGWGDDSANRVYALRTLDTYAAQLARLSDRDAPAELAKFRKNAATAIRRCRAALKRGDAGTAAREMERAVSAYFHARATVAEEDRRAGWWWREGGRAGSDLLHARTRAIKSRAQEAFADLRRANPRLSVPSGSRLLEARGYGKARTIERWLYPPAK